MNISQSLLAFKLITIAWKVLITSFESHSLAMQSFRALGLPQAIEKNFSLL